MIQGRALLAVAALAAPLLAAGAEATTPGAGGVGTWQDVHRELRRERDLLSATLATAHDALLVRAEREDPNLVLRLSREPPRPRPSGYGILPEIQPDKPLIQVEPKQSTYSLQVLADRFSRNLSRAGRLARRANEDPEAPLEPLVADFEQLRKHLRNLESHLEYHAKWQEVMAQKSGFYEGQNKIVAQVHEMQALRARGAPVEHIEELRQEILDRLTTFYRVPGLHVDMRADGRRVLPVKVWTDVEDDAFLAAFREGVEDAFNRSAAARALAFSIELELRPIPPGELYLSGAPERGTAIDLKAHQALFPEGSLVLTTGAKSTHAMRGRSILLGPSPFSRRALAHEFAHLLGFADAYLRGYEGDLQGPFGPVIVEWTGLTDDLMGNPGRGRVSTEMVETLIEMYGR